VEASRREEAASAGRSAFFNRLVPVPAGLSDEVKATAGQAERAWEAVTGSLAFLGAGGGAAAAAGIAALGPVAPFVAAVAAGSFYFKLRAKWAKEDPPRPDYHVATEFRPPPVDLMAVMPPGPIPRGAAIISLLHAAGASVEATVLAVERAMGASLGAWGAEPEAAALHETSRMREAQQHAARTALLAAGLHSAADDFGYFLDREIHVDFDDRPPSDFGVRPGRDFDVRDRSWSLGDLLDAGALGHVIAAGVDARALSARLSWDDSWRAPITETLHSAGVAAEEFGAALGRWADELRLG
jgi:hypothetical protein